MRYASPVSTRDLPAAIRDYLASRDDVVFALLFGSAATGRQTQESDVDVAVYLREVEGRADASLAARTQPPSLPDVERADARFRGESEVWAALERICGRTVDLVVLNRAPATIAAGALLTGELLLSRDPALYSRYYLTVSTLAEDERDFAEDYVRIKARSQSLSAIDRGRLVRIVDFLEDELADAAEFAALDLERYSTDRTFRRSVERWVENLVNASIDAAKIVLASERRPVPQTYRETLEQLGTVEGFRELGELPGRLAENTRVRNMLAHEYLDLRYTQVHEVVAGAARDYGALVRALRAWMTS